MNIHELVRKDDIKSLQKLIEDKENLNRVSGDMRNTPLHISASQGHIEAAKILLEAGADLKQRNKRGALPSHLAVTYNHIEILELILAKDIALLNTTDRAGNTLLHIAVWKRHPEIVEFLLKQGADEGIKNKEGNTVNHMAVLWSRPYILKLLLRHNNNHIDAMNLKGFTPMHLAAMNNQEECIQCLLIHGAKPSKRDKFGRTPIELGDEYTQKIFIKYEIYKAIQTSCATDMIPILVLRKYIDNCTALHIVALFSDSRALIHQLISNGAKVNALDSYGHTPLRYALQSGCIHNIRSLINSGGDSEHLRMENDQTPLHRAIQRHDLELAQFLLTHKAIVDAPDHVGDTPLLYAVVNHSRKGVKLLLNHGANPVITDQHGNTPLHLSVTANNVDITEDLLAVNPEVIDNINSYGHTPIMCAILGRSAKLTRLLLKHDANLYIKDRNGTSSYDLAITTKSEALIELVTEHESKLNARTQTV